MSNAAMMMREKKNKQCEVHPARKRDGVRTHNTMLGANRATQPCRTNLLLSIIAYKRQPMSSNSLSCALARKYFRGLSIDQLRELPIAYTWLHGQALFAGKETAVP